MKSGRKLRAISTEKKLLSIVLLLLFWVLFYAIWCAALIPFLQGKPADMALFRDYLLQLKGYRQHLWYLFMLVGAYIVIPVLRLFVRKENKEYILGLIVLSMIVQFGTQTACVLTRGMSFTVCRARISYQRVHLVREKQLSE